MIRKLLRAFLILAALGLPVGDALAQSATYDYTLDVTGLTTGVGIDQSHQASIAATWGTTCCLAFQQNGVTGTVPTVTVVTQGTSNSVACKTSAKCEEDLIPQGTYGRQWGSFGNFGYYIGAQDPTILNVEYDIMVEAPFDMHGIIKTPMSIGIWDTTANAYQTLRTNIQCTGSYTSTTCNTGKETWVIYLQDDPTGGHDGCTSYFGSTQVLTNHWYHFKQQQDLTVRAHPVAKVWIDNTLLFSCTWVPPAGTAAAHVQAVITNAWAGGGSGDKPAVNDNYLLDNVHVYSGTAPPVDTTAPSVPTGLTYSLISLSSPQVCWTASTDVDSTVAGYHVRRGSTLVSTQPGLCFTDTGLTPGNTYSYTVDAYDPSSNTSAQSSALSVSMVDNMATPTPTSFGATNVTQTSISLAWHASVDPIDPPVTYILKRNGTQIATPSGLTYVDTGLTPTTAYTYTLAASDASGNVSTYTTGLPVTTLSPSSGPPTVPTNLAATFTGPTQIILAWTASTSPQTVAGYDIYENGTKIGTSVSPTYSALGLTPSTSYTFTVDAFDPDNNTSAQSSPGLVASTQDNSTFMILVPNQLNGQFH